MTLLWWYLIQITKTLDIKVSDFGISIWKEDTDKEGMQVLFYKAKDIYVVNDTKETLDFKFDLR